jgi:protein gp37
VWGVSTTKIQWTQGDDGSPGKTWNPVTGCTKVSEGCDHCYAETFAERWRGVPGHPFEQGFDVRLWPERLGVPLRWRKPKRVFVNSMSDLFIGREQVPDAFVAAVWVTMFWTSPAARWRASGRPVHTFQILTKRPARLRSWVRRWSDPASRRVMLTEAACRGWVSDEDLEAGPDMPAVLPNVWLGVSAETQRWLDVRVPRLLATPAGVRFVSAEPLLGSIDLRQFLLEPAGGAGPGLDWVIVGGESGPKARPMHPDWARLVRDQCEVARVPFFMKQWGTWVPYEQDAQPPFWASQHGDLIDGHHLPGDLTDHEPRRGWWWPDPDCDVIFRRVGKDAAGELLDGRPWKEFPDLEVLLAGASS